MTEFIQNPPPPQPPREILSMADYKSLRNITGADQDPALTVALPIAEDAVVRYTQRAFNVEPVTETRSFVYEGQPIIEIDDATSVSAVSFDGRAIASDTFILGPQSSSEVFYWVELLEDSNASFDPMIDPFIRNVHPGRRRRRRVIEVTASYGWPTVPLSIRGAVADIADELYEEVVQAQGVTAEAIADYSRVFANEDPRQAPAALPPRVRQLLDPFRRVVL